MIGSRLFLFIILVVFIIFSYCSTLYLSKYGTLFKVAKKTINTDITGNTVRTDTNKNVKNSRSINSSSTAKFIEADLSDMTLRTYNGGKLVKEYPIVSKGKPGSYYETPAGDFRVKHKDTNRYSSIGHVYMPYALHYYGNFFIHGIPYFENGTRVSTNYSGGCIRIADNHMKEIYDFTDIGTDISIINSNDIYISNIALENISVQNLSTILLSLEVINQEKTVRYSTSTIKFKDLNYYIASGDSIARELIINYIGKNNYEAYTTERLLSMGITSDINNLNKEDKIKFINHISNNKSYTLSYFQ